MPNLFQRITKRFFIICNIVVAVLFITGANVKYFDPKQWWFAGLLTLSLPYIILTLIIFSFCWVFAKKIWFLISVIAIAVCWDAVKNIFPLHLSPEFKKEKNAPSIRIMSWNVEQFNILEHKTHPELKDQMFELINQYQPDIACFQEMVGGDYDKAINYLGDFKRRLNFSGYYFSYQNRFDFDQQHHFGIITFSKYPFINKQTIVNYPNDYNSTFQYVDMVINADTVRLFNIHLQSLHFSQNNRQYLDKPNINTDSTISESKNIISKLKQGFFKRAVQADNVKREIDKSPYPVMVCGDFNDVPNSYAYTKIGNGLQNAFVEKGFGFGRTFSGISPTLRIDNIFAGKNFTIEQFTRVPKLLSDHFPVIADVSVHLNK